MSGGKKACGTRQNMRQHCSLVRQHFAEWSHLHICVSRWSANTHTQKMQLLYSQLKSYLFICAWEGKKQPRCSQKIAAMQFTTVKHQRRQSHTLSTKALSFALYHYWAHTRTHIQTHTHTRTDTLVALGSQLGPLNCSIRQLFRKVNSPSDSSCASCVCIRFVYASAVCMCSVPIYPGVGWVKGESCFLCVSATKKLSESEEVRTHQRAWKPSDRPWNLSGVKFFSTQLLWFHLVNQKRMDFFFIITSLMDLTVENTVFITFCRVLQMLSVL